MIPTIAILAGGVGAVARYVMSGAVQRRAGRFPAGTMAVNLLGALLVGFVAGWTQAGSLASAAGVGFLGGFSTFSTWQFESLELVLTGRPRLAAVNLALPLVGGVGLCAVGFWLSG